MQKSYYTVISRGIFYQTLRKNISPQINRKAYSTGFHSGGNITHNSVFRSLNNSPATLHNNHSFSSLLKTQNRFYTMTSAPRVLTGKN